MKQLRFKIDELGGSNVLSREQMRGVTGGYVPPPSCSTGCSVGNGSVVNGTWRVTTGTCSVTTIVGQGNSTMTICECSQSGTSVTSCGSPTNS